MNDQSLAPARFYTATEVGALAPIVVNGQSLNGWQRVTAVRVCVLTQTLGGGTRMADKAGAARTYLDCSDTPKNQPTGSTITRYTQVFGLRNALKQTF
jgi:type IV pilus assembly protein PilW